MTQEIRRYATGNSITTVRARFFTGYPIETRRVLIEADGTVRVWDEIAGHYTSCHALARSAERRIVRQARNGK